MKILVSNDDGIGSQGIYELVQELKKIGDVTVVAPLTEQSAVGHAITMKSPLRVTKYFVNNELFGYAVDGTPADCIKMGVRNILKDIPDIVVSGINHGSNAATAIIYSGTVSAAREAAIMDIPAIAVSVTSYNASHFNYPAKVAAHFCKLVKEKGLRKGSLLNINVPDIPEADIRGIVLTKQGHAKWDETYVCRQDPYGKDYYWLKGEMVVLDTEPDIDQVAVMNNYASVSPIHFDLTDYDLFKDLVSWQFESIKI